MQYKYIDDNATYNDGSILINNLLIQSYHKIKIIFTSEFRFSNMAGVLKYINFGIRRWVLLQISYGKNEFLFNAECAAWLVGATVNLRSKTLRLLLRWTINGKVTHLCLSSISLFLSAPLLSLLIYII
jgi:hypothetical protein